MLSAASKFTRIMILILLFVSFTLNGCYNDKKINAPAEIKYTVKNPLTTEEYNSGDGNQFTYTYITITGLKDKETEQKINDKIKALYDEALIQDLPPYRGIKKYIPEDAKIIQENVYMSPGGNFNNILSVILYKNTTYALPDSDGQISEQDKSYYENLRYVSETASLNIDLNTGEEFKLKDIFCDNVDWLEILNDYMSEFLSSNYADEEGYFYTMNGDLKLVESFKGLSEDQKFVLYPYGISLIFDYDTPQFDTRFMASMPVINYKELDENLAVTKRFYDETKNIFESEEPLVKSLLYGLQQSDIADYEHKTEGRVNFYSSWSYSSELPEKIQKKIEDLKPDYSEVMADLNKELDQIPNEVFNEFGMIGYECYIYADIIGDYINVMKSSFVSLPTGYHQMMEYHCFDANTLEELQLTDLFYTGYDYKPVIIEAIKKAIMERGTDPYGRTVDDFSDNEIEKLYQNIKGFTLNSEEMYIPVDEINSEGSSYTMSVYIPYSEFGCDNMKIF